MKSHLPRAVGSDSDRMTNKRKWILKENGPGKEKMKKLISVFLCVTLLIALGVSAFAATATKKDRPLLKSVNPGPIPVGAVYASSELVENGRRYEAKNAVDGDLSSCWIEGADGYGTGETLTIFFNGIYDVSRFSIAAGWAADDNVYNMNAKPKVINMYFSSSPDMYYEVELDRTSSVQTLWIDERNVSWVIIEIADVYKGDDGVYDTCLSEITFYE